MKKNIIAASFLFSTIISSPFINICYATKATISQHLYTQSNKPTNIHDSRELIYQDIIMTLLEPYISKEIEKYYKKPYSFALFDVDVINAKRPEGFRTFTFILSLRIYPFVGAHNTVGIDKITINISPGEVKVEKFEHIKSYEIPPWLKN